MPALIRKTDNVGQRLTARIDGVEENLTALIDGVEENLTALIDGVGQKLDVVAADLAAHRRDTETHTVYGVRE